MIYTSTNRARVKEENPSASFGDIARLVSAEFKSLSPEEKRVYEEKAKKDKERYKKEMENYVPPDDSDEDGGRGKKTKKKDPNAPKRGQTNFMIFSSHVRAKVKEENPDATFGQIGKLIGKKFQALSSEEKEKYNQLAAKDKERYQKEMA